MKRTAMLLAVVAIAASALLHAQETFDRVCGVLRSESRKPLSSSSYEAAFRTLRHKELRIFRRVAGVPCCRTDDFIMKTRTGVWGDFNFKNLGEGEYWIATTADGNELSMPLRLDRNLRRSEQCKDRNFVIEPDGRLRFGVTVEVD